MISLKTDQIFGVYTHVADADAPRLEKWLRGRKIDFLVNPDDCARLRAQEQTTLVFDENDPARVRELLLKIEQNVEIDADAASNRDGAYLPPVAHLLTLGPAEQLIKAEPFARLGLLPEHAPELLRMALDPELHSEVAESSAIWAPIHAWRALSLLKAEEAIAPLIGLFRRLDEDGDDMIGGDLPLALAAFGAPALPPLTQAISDSSLDIYARAAATSAVVQAAMVHPDLRDSCVAILSKQLELCADQPNEFNGFLVSDLLDLEAIEAAPIIARAFAANRVDTMIAGTWKAVWNELRSYLDGTDASTVEGLADERDPEEPTVPIQLAGKIGRNDRCPCGSGKKYKKCCGAAE